MLNFDTPGPRRRGGGLSASFGRSAPARSVALSIPDGLIAGRGGRPFKRRISSFNVWFSARKAASAAFSFSPSCRSRSTSPINPRTNPTSSAGLKCSSESIEPEDIHSLNHIFLSLTPPAPESAPVTHNASNPLKSPDSDEKFQGIPNKSKAQFQASEGEN